MNRKILNGWLQLTSTRNSGGRIYDKKIYERKLEKYRKQIELERKIEKRNKIISDIINEKEN